MDDLKATTESIAAAIRPAPLPKTNRLTAADSIAAAPGETNGVTASVQDRLVQQEPKAAGSDQTVFGAPGEKSVHGNGAMTFATTTATAAGRTK